MLILGLCTSLKPELSLIVWRKTKRGNSYFGCFGGTSDNEMLVGMPAAADAEHTAHRHIHDCMDGSILPP
mgnify:CR=1 FL=1